MARKTREQALATRQRILDAAVEVFLEKGFQHSSLQNVAEGAGVTRGAVYWHFRHRGDLLAALLEMTQLPWQTVRPLPEAALPGMRSAPLRQALTEMAIAPLVSLENSLTARQLLRIVGQIDPDDSAGLLTRVDAGRNAGLQYLQMAMVQAASSGALRSQVAAEPAATALGLFALVDGLMQHWLRQPTTFALTTVGMQAVQSHLAGVLRS